MSTQDLARALAARLEPDQPDDPEMGTPDLSARVAEEELVAELATLAERLTELPAPPAPTADFRAALATRLSAAPTPSSLAASVAAPASETVHPTEAVPVPTTRELSRALDEALTRLGQGASPANLERELGLAGEELAPLLDLATALRDAPEAPAPEPDFRAALGAHLAAAPAPRSLAPAPAAPGSGLLRRLWRSTAFTAAAAATIVLFLVAGVTYASADAMPGEPLYPVKRTAERARLWLATDAQALALHMNFAELRLDEALAEPGHAGSALADFSREVTAALAVVDGALASGAERAAVTEPLLQWLLASRGELIAHREGLPAMAWRVALAQVDAAIAALRAGRPLADRPVPRLHDPVAVLALRADDTFPSAWARALPRPIALGENDGADDGEDEDTDIAEAGEDETAAASELLALAATDGTASETQDPAAGAESPEPAPVTQDPVAPPAGSDPGGENPPSGGGDDGGGDGGGGDGGGGGVDPNPTEKPTPRPTKKPEPTAEPTTEPPPAPPSTEPPPTDPPAPVLPTNPPPASPTPPPLIPTVPPAPPTSEPSPTATAAPVVPASIDVVCTPNTLLPAGRADCGIEMYEEIPADWTVEWVASLGTIEAPHPERSEDRRWARYEATNSLQGVDKVYATVHATLRDAAGNEVSGSTIIYIVPRLDDSVTPPGDDLAPGVSDG